MSALAPNQQSGILGSGRSKDIITTNLTFDVATLIQDLLALSPQTLPLGHTGTLGSVEAPIVAYAPDGLVLAGNLLGWGVLLVNESLLEQGGVHWTGLVIVRSNGGNAPSFEITGAVLLYNDVDDPASFVISGTAQVNYSREVLTWLKDRLFGGT